MATSRKVNQMHIPGPCVMLFASTFVGDFASGITVTKNEELQIVGPGSTIVQSEARRIAESYELTCSVHGITPKQLAYLNGFAASPSQRTTLPNSTGMYTSANVACVRAGAIGASAGAGLNLSTGAQTSTIQLFNQDMLGVSSGAESFAAADFTCSGTVIYRTGSIVSGTAYPVLATYDRAQAAARVVYGGGQTGVYRGTLKFAWMLQDGQGAGLKCYAAIPVMNSIALKGSKDSEKNTIDVKFILLADLDKAVGKQCWEFAELDY